MSQPENLNHLALLLELEAQIRKLEDLQDLFYFLVNEPYRLSPFRQAILFDARHKVKAISGLANLEKNAPLVHWLENNTREQANETTDFQELALQQLPEGGNEWLPEKILLMPVQSPSGQRFGTLLLARDTGWARGEVSLLQHFLETAGYSWERFKPPAKEKIIHRLSTKIKIAAAVAGVALMVFPVRLSVLAEGEIIPKDPVVVRAPMVGVIDEILVKPNQKVEQGDVLFKMETTELENERLIALKKLESLRAQYRQLTRRALIESKEKARLTIVASQVKEQQAELKRISDMLSRATVRAPKAATVVLQNAQDWAGKPTQVGEKILDLANENDIQIEAWLPVGDAINLPENNNLRLFLNASPLSPIDATITRVSFKADQRPQGIMAHRIVAKMAPSENSDIRLGAQGTARIEGERVTLFYWVFRRPLATIRQFIGI